MFTIALSEEEEQVLSTLLDNSIEDLRMEIHGTDRAQYKEMLHHQRNVLIQIRKQIHYVSEVSDALAF